MSLPDHCLSSPTVRSFTLAPLPTYTLLSTPRTTRPSTSTPEPVWLLTGVQPLYSPAMDNFRRFRRTWPPDRVTLPPRATLAMKTLSKSLEASNPVRV